MKTLTLQINDDYFDKIVSFLEILPKKAVKIQQHDKEQKLKEIEQDLSCAFEDIKHNRTKKIRSIT